jgi:hypothetical protein
VSDTRTMTLTDFLLARIAEDEDDARSPHWRDCGIEDGDPIRTRWLAECEAKRRIVEAYLEERTRRDIYQSDEARSVEDDGSDLMGQAQARRSSAARTRGLEIAVESLALPYADHPDYDEAWRP